MARKSYVDVWVEKETEHKMKALENASRHFDKNDSLTVNTLEAIYGQESSFGLNPKKGERGQEETAGEFRMTKETAERVGLTVSKENDQRFDIDDASWGAAKYLKMLHSFFTKEANLGSGLRTIPVRDYRERKKFSIAGYNGGEGRIARAQHEARKAGKNPEKWNDVKHFLKVAGAPLDKVKEIIKYVDKVLSYEKEFSKKSKADKKAKFKRPKKLSKQRGGCRWVTIDDNPVCI